MHLLTKLLPQVGGNLRTFIKNGEAFTVQTMEKNGLRCINVFDKNFNEVLNKAYSIEKQGNSIVKNSFITYNDPFYSILNGRTTTTIRNYDKNKNLTSVVKQEFEKDGKLSTQTLIDDLFEKETCYDLNEIPNQQEFWKHRKLGWGEYKPLQTFHKLEDFYTDLTLFPHAIKK